MMAASTSRISTGCSVIAAARSGRLQISSIPTLARISRYCFKYRPACRINQTGRTSVGRRRHASRKRLFDEAIRMWHLVFRKNAKISLLFHSQRAAKYILGLAGRLTVNSLGSKCSWPAHFRHSGAFEGSGSGSFSRAALPDALEKLLHARTEVGRDVRFEVQIGNPVHL